MSRNKTIIFRTLFIFGCKYPFLNEFLLLTVRAQGNAERHLNYLVHKLVSVWFMPATLKNLEFPASIAAATTLWELRAANRHFKID